MVSAETPGLVLDFLSAHALERSIRIEPQGQVPVFPCCVPEFPLDAGLVRETRLGKRIENMLIEVVVGPESVGLEFEQSYAVGPSLGK